MEAMPAASKLRLVLDYVPCEPCLEQPVADQEILCTVCARLHRQVAVRVATHATVILERPTVEPAAPVVIEPAASVPQAEPGSPDVAVATPAPLAPPALAVVFRGDELPEEALFTVVVEPYEEPAPVAAAPVVEPEPEFDEGFEFVPPSDSFEFVRGDAAPAAPVAPPPPRSEPFVEDDFVFRPPARDEAVAAPEREEPAPTEEIAVEPAEERSLWSPPAEFLPDEASAPAPATEGVYESEAVVEMEPVPEEPVIEAELVPDEEVEMEILPDEPAGSSSPSPLGPDEGTTDLYKLRGFDVGAEGALARVGIREVAHLAGHDAGELAVRTSIPIQRLLPWTQVANLHSEIGVPLEAAQALVNAGVAGPRGLQEMDAETIVDRVQAFGGSSVDIGDVKRWKRRA